LDPLQAKKIAEALAAVRPDSSELRNLLRRINQCKALQAFSSQISLSSLSILELEQNMGHLKGVKLPVMLQVKVTGAMATQIFMGLPTNTNLEEVRTSANQVAHMLSMDGDDCRHPGEWNGSDPEFAANFAESFSLLDQCMDVLPDSLAGEGSEDKRRDEHLRSVATECNLAMKAGLGVPFRLC